jgi:hypothetical protein
VIPEDLVTACVRHARSEWREDGDLAIQELLNLGISPDTEFGQIASRFNLAMLTDFGPSNEQLIDVCWGGSMADTAEFVHSTWGVPERFVPFTSCEGEGAYLYDRTSGEVWDFSLASQAGFVAGEQSPMFVSFFDFMRWYLDVTPATSHP